MKFVVIAAKRTGSSHFVNLLSSHPDIFCHGNVFKGNSLPPILWPNSARPGAQTEKKLKQELGDLRDRSPHEFLEKIFALGHGRPFVGFKIFVRQNDEILKALLDDPSVRKIVLYRTNLLANYASGRAAQATGAWNRNADHTEKPQERVYFDEADFLKATDKHVAFYRWVFEELNRRNVVYSTVTYDTINEPRMLSGVISFIGADAGKPLNLADQPRVQVKQGSPDILNRFSNMKVLRKFLEKRNLMHWRDEGELRLDYLSEGVHDDAADTEED